MHLLGGAIDSAEQNKQLVRQFYEGIDKGNIDVLDEIVAGDYLNQSPAPIPGLPQAETASNSRLLCFGPITSLSGRRLEPRNRFIL